LEIQEILELLEKGKISSNTAKKMLSLYSIEEIEGIAKIDINRRKRKGIPEVIFAETKSLEEIKKIIKITIEKTNSLVVSRIKKEDYPKIISFCKRLKIKIKEGKKASTLLLFKKPIKFHGGKVGIITAGTSVLLAMT
jgi:NCAIR mutase (PurE)-related protein